MTELIPTLFHCAYCGEQNDTLVDPSGGSHQSYVEDCIVCCRPNVLHVSISSGSDAIIEAEYEE